MKISLKWLSKYISLPDVMKNPSEKSKELAETLTSLGLEVESINDEGKNFNFVVIGEILEKLKHEGSDRLSVCKVSTGDKTHQIICGAQNHKQGDKVVVSLPGAVLPGNFEIKVSKIRGVESFGMLCSEVELGLAEKSEGIMILPATAVVGESFSKYAKKDDVVFDLKVTPNRADCLSHLGLARELSAVYSRPFELPLTPFQEGRDSAKKLVKVTIEDSERCPRYSSRIVKGVKVGPSPEWMKTLLESVGLRSINNVVDITNFVMYELGQPLHAFDLSQIGGNQISIRSAKDSEIFETLDGAELKLDGTELVIADAEGPIALAGVIGGLNSGISEKTVDVFIESAVFVPWTVRRTARKYGLETDSSYRFSRGVDPDTVLLALNRACQLLVEFAEGTVCADVHDFYPRPATRPRIELDLNFISSRLGITVEPSEAKGILERLGCDVSGSGQKLMVNPPTYRSDLKLQEDLGEELLRFKGFQNVAEKIPSLTAAPTDDSKGFTLEFKLANDLRKFGFSQAVNLNLTSGVNEKKFVGSNGGEIAELGLSLSSVQVRVKNPINQDLDVMRGCVLFSLLKNVSSNLKHGRSQGGLFEIAPVFSFTSLVETPFREVMRVGIVSWGGLKSSDWGKKSTGHGFYEFKGVVEQLLASWGINRVAFEAVSNSPDVFHSGQIAKIIVEGKPIGVLGSVHPEKLRELDLGVPIIACEMNLESLFNGQPRQIRVKTFSKFPSVQRDVAFLAPKSVACSQILKELKSACGSKATGVQLFDLFEGDSIGADKVSFAFRVTYQDMEKTLSNEEVNASHQEALKTVSSKLGLSVR